MYKVTVYTADLIQKSHVLSIGRCLSSGEGVYDDDEDLVLDLKGVPSILQLEGVPASPRRLPSVGAFYLSLYLSIWREIMMKRVLKTMKSEGGCIPR